MNVCDIFYSILEESENQTDLYRKGTFEAKQIQNNPKQGQKTENLHFFEQKAQKTEKKSGKMEENPLFGVEKGENWFELFYSDNTTRHIRHSTAENLLYYLKRLNRLYGRTEIPVRIELLIIQ